MQIISIQDDKRFLYFINQHVDRTDFRFKYLISFLNMAFGRGEATVTGNTSIYKLRDEWVIYIETERQLFIYGSDNPVIIDALSNNINLEMFAGYEIMGDYDLVYRLLHHQNAQGYTIIKDRIFYTLGHSDKLLQALDDTQPNQNDIDELTKMMLDYYVEEYDGTRSKTEEMIRPTIVKHINRNSIHIYREAGIIKSFCTVINPDVGILYTKPDFRNQHIGKRLLSTCSRVILTQKNTCFVMTDMKNIPSNKICVDIGYEEISKHTNIRL